MAQDADRLDGWKAIGAHFGRDRTTAIRWAQNRGLPVRSMPGGKTRTVFALRSELDAWARRAETEGEPARSPPPPPAPNRVAIKSGWPARAVLLGAAAPLILSALPFPQLVRSKRLLPTDPAVSALYIQGRDEAARRDARSLADAVVHLGQVTRRAPAFAPAYADLAQAKLLMTEYGTEPQHRSYAQARAAARHALRLDPANAAALRALGFLAYWADGDRTTAARRLREALRQEPDDALTHFWIANILVDNGEFPAAERHYAAARLRNPGSLMIRTEQAWARWSAGDHGAEAELQAIARDHPRHAVAHECLSMARLSTGDWRGYLKELGVRARLKGDPNLIEDSARGERILAAGGVPALRKLAVADVLAASTLQRDDPVIAALFFSAAGHRDALLDLLVRADASGRPWGRAGYRRRLAEHWQGDGMIVALLARRAPPPMAQEIDRL